MLKARGRSPDGRTILYFGLSRKNAELLLQDKPILVDLVKDLGIENGPIVVIMGGETDADLAKVFMPAVPGSRPSRGGTAGGDPFHETGSANNVVPMKRRAKAKTARTRTKPKRK